MQGYLAGVSEGTRVLLILSVILFAGFIMTRLTNTLNLPKVSGYIMAGILIGPCGLNLIPRGYHRPHGICQRSGTGVYRVWSWKVF